jgi:exodeoxyribonuclease VII small subunit
VVKKDPFHFEESLNKLEQIIAKLSNEGVPFEESLSLYEKGIKEYEKCFEYLSLAKKKITLLKDKSAISTDKEKTPETEPLSF